MGRRTRVSQAVAGPADHPPRGKTPTGPTADRPGVNTVSPVEGTEAGQFDSDMLLGLPRGSQFFEVTDVAPDGHCMFRSVIRGLSDQEKTRLFGGGTNENDQIRDLRRRVAAKERENIENYKDYFQGGVAQLLLHANEIEFWEHGAELELRVLEEILDRPIVAIGEENWKINNLDQIEHYLHEHGGIYSDFCLERPPVFIFYTGSYVEKNLAGEEIHQGGHYMALQPQTNTDISKLLEYLIALSQIQSLGVLIRKEEEEKKREENARKLQELRTLSSQIRMPAAELTKKVSSVTSASPRPPSAQPPSAASATPLSSQSAPSPAPLTPGAGPDIVEPSLPGAADDGSGATYGMPPMPSGVESANAGETAASSSSKKLSGLLPLLVLNSPVPSSRPEEPITLSQELEAEKAKLSEEVTAEFTKEQQEQKSLLETAWGAVGYAPDVLLTKTSQELSSILTANLTGQADPNATIEKLKESGIERLSLEQLEQQRHLRRVAQGTVSDLEAEQKRLQTEIQRVEPRFNEAQRKMKDQEATQRDEGFEAVRQEEEAKKSQRKKPAKQKPAAPRMVEVVVGDDSADKRPDRDLLLQELEQLRQQLKVVNDKLVQLQGGVATGPSVADTAFAQQLDQLIKTRTYQIELIQRLIAYKKKEEGYVEKEKRLSKLSNQGLEIILEQLTKKQQEISSRMQETETTEQEITRSIKNWNRTRKEISGSEEYVESKKAELLADVELQIATQTTLMKSTREKSSNVKKARGYVNNAIQKVRAIETAIKKAFSAIEEKKGSLETLQREFVEACRSIDLGEQDIQSLLSPHADDAAIEAIFDKQLKIIEGEAQRQREKKQKELNAAEEIVRNATTRYQNVSARGTTEEQTEAQILLAEAKKKRESVQDALTALVTQYNTKKDQVTAVLRGVAVYKEKCKKTDGEITVLKNKALSKKEEADSQVKDVFQSITELNISSDSSSLPDLPQQPFREALIECQLDLGIIGDELMQQMPPALREELEKQFVKHKQGASEKTVAASEWDRGKKYFWLYQIIYPLLNELATSSRQLTEEEKQQFAVLGYLCGIAHLVSFAEAKNTTPVSGNGLFSLISALKSAIPAASSQAACSPEQRLLANAAEAEIKGVVDKILTQEQKNQYDLYQRLRRENQTLTPEQEAEYRFYEKLLKGDKLAPEVKSKYKLYQKLLEKISLSLLYERPASDFLFSYLLNLKALLGKDGCLLDVGSVPWNLYYKHFGLVIEYFFLSEKKDRPRDKPKEGEGKKFGERVLEKIMEVAATDSFKASLINAEKIMLERIEPTVRERVKDYVRGLPNPVDILVKVFSGQDIDSRYHKVRQYFEALVNMVPAETDEQRLIRDAFLAWLNQPGQQQMLYDWLKEGPKKGQEGEWLKGIINKIIERGNLKTGGIADFIEKMPEYSTLCDQKEQTGEKGQPVVIKTVKQEVNGQIGKFYDMWSAAAFALGHRHVNLPVEMHLSPLAIRENFKNSILLGRLQLFEPLLNVSDENHRGQALFLYFLIRDQLTQLGTKVLSEREYEKIIEEAKLQCIQADIEAKREKSKGTFMGGVKEALTPAFRTLSEDIESIFRDVLSKVISFECKNVRLSQAACFALREKALTSFSADRAFSKGMQEAIQQKQVEEQHRILEEWPKVCADQLLLFSNRISAQEIESKSDSVLEDDVSRQKTIYGISTEKNPLEEQWSSWAMPVYRNYIQAEMNGQVTVIMNGQVISKPAEEVLLRSLVGWDKVQEIQSETVLDIDIDILVTRLLKIKSVDDISGLLGIIQDAESMDKIENPQDMMAVSWKQLVSQLERGIPEALAAITKKITQWAAEAVSQDQLKRQDLPRAEAVSQKQLKLQDLPLDFKSKIEKVLEVVQKMREKYAQTKVDKKKREGLEALKKILKNMETDLKTQLQQCTILCDSCFKAMFPVPLPPDADNLWQDVLKEIAEAWTSEAEKEGSRRSLDEVIQSLISNWKKTVQPSGYKETLIRFCEFASEEQLKGMYTLLGVLCGKCLWNDESRKSILTAFFNSEYSRMFPFFSKRICPLVEALKQKVSQNEVQQYDAVISQFKEKTIEEMQAASGAEEALEAAIFPKIEPGEASSGPPQLIVPEHLKFSTRQSMGPYLKFQSEMILKAMVMARPQSQISPLACEQLDAECHTPGSREVSFLDYFFDRLTYPLLAIEQNVKAATELLRAQKQASYHLRRLEELVEEIQEKLRNTSVSIAPKSMQDWIDEVNTIRDFLKIKSDLSRFSGRSDESAPDLREQGRALISWIKNEGRLSEQLHRIQLTSMVGCYRYAPSVLRKAETQVKTEREEENKKLKDAKIEGVIRYAILQFELNKEWRQASRLRKQLEKGIREDSFDSVRTWMLQRKDILSSPMWNRRRSNREFELSVYTNALNTINKTGDENHRYFDKNLSTGLQNEIEKYSKPIPFMRKRERLATLARLQASIAAFNPIQGEFIIPAEARDQQPALAEPSSPSPVPLDAAGIAAPLPSADRDFEAAHARAEQFFTKDYPLLSESSKGQILTKLVDELNRIKALSMTRDQELMMIERLVELIILADPKNDTLRNEVGAQLIKPCNKWIQSFFNREVSSTILSAEANTAEMSRIDRLKNVLTRTQLMTEIQNNQWIDLFSGVTVTDYQKVDHYLTQLLGSDTTTLVRTYRNGWFRAVINAEPSTITTHLDKVIHKEGEKSYLDYDVVRALNEWFDKLDLDIQRHQNPDRSHLFSIVRSLESVEEEVEPSEEQAALNKLRFHMMTVLIRAVIDGKATFSIAEDGISRIAFERQSYPFSNPDGGKAFCQAYLSQVLKTKPAIQLALNPDLYAFLAKYYPDELTSEVGSAIHQIGEARKIWDTLSQIDKIDQDTFEKNKQILLSGIDYLVENPGFIELSRLKHISSAVQINESSASSSELRRIRSAYSALRLINVLRTYDSTKPQDFMTSLEDWIKDQGELAHQFYRNTEDLAYKDMERKRQKIMQQLQAAEASQDSNIAWLRILLEQLPTELNPAQPAQPPMSFFKALQSFLKSLDSEILDSEINEVIQNLHQLNQAMQNIDGAMQQAPKMRWIQDAISKVANRIAGQHPNNNLSQFIAWTQVLSSLQWPQGFSSSDLEIFKQEINKQLINSLQRLGRQDSPLLTVDEFGKIIGQYVGLIERFQNDQEQWLRQLNEFIPAYILRLSGREPLLSGDEFRQLIGQFVGLIEHFQSHQEQWLGQLKAFITAYISRLSGREPHNNLSQFIAWTQVLSSLQWPQGFPSSDLEIFKQEINKQLINSLQRLDQQDSPLLTVDEFGKVIGQFVRLIKRFPRDQEQWLEQLNAFISAYIPRLSGREPLLSGDEFVQLSSLEDQIPSARDSLVRVINEAKTHLIENWTRTKISAIQANTSSADMQAMMNVLNGVQDPSVTEAVNRAKRSLSQYFHVSAHSPEELGGSAGMEMGGEASATPPEARSRPGSAESTDLELSSEQKPHSQMDEAFVADAEKLLSTTSRDNLTLVECYAAITGIIEQCQVLPVACFDVGYQLTSDLLESRLLWAIFNNFNKIKEKEKKIFSAQQDSEITERTTLREDYLALAHRVHILARDCQDAAAAAQNAAAQKSKGKTPKKEGSAASSKFLSFADILKLANQLATVSSPSSLQWRKRVQDLYKTQADKEAAAKKGKSPQKSDSQMLPAFDTFCKQAIAAIRTTITAEPDDSVKVSMCLSLARRIREGNWDGPVKESLEKEIENLRIEFMSRLSGGRIPRELGDLRQKIHNFNLIPTAEAGLDEKIEQFITYLNQFMRLREEAIEKGVFQSLVEELEESMKALLEEYYFALCQESPTGRCVTAHVYLDALSQVDQVGKILGMQSPVLIHVKSVIKGRTDVSLETMITKPLKLEFELQIVEDTKQAIIQLFQENHTLFEKYKQSMAADEDESRQVQDFNRCIEIALDFVVNEDVKNFFKSSEIKIWNQVVTQLGFGPDDLENLQSVEQEIKRDITARMNETKQKVENIESGMDPGTIRRLSDAQNIGQVATVEQWVNQYGSRLGLTASRLAVLPCAIMKALLTGVPAKSAPPPAEKADPADARVSDVHYYVPSVVETLLNSGAEESYSVGLFLQEETELPEADFFGSERTIIPYLLKKATIDDFSSAYPRSDRETMIRVLRQIEAKIKPRLPAAAEKKTPTKKKDKAAASRDNAERNEVKLQIIQSWIEEYTKAMPSPPMASSPAAVPSAAPPPPPLARRDSAAPPPSPAAFFSGGHGAKPPPSQTPLKGEGRSRPRP